MKSVFDIANHFLSLESLDHKKLQKLCYYTQCWFYGLNNKQKLIDTDFEAWIHGPVSPELFREYKRFGWLDIPKREKSSERLSPEIKTFLNEVYRVYGKFSGDELEVLSHSEMPWQNARKGLLATESCTNKISYEDMYTFCREKLKESE